MAGLLKYWQDTVISVFIGSHHIYRRYCLSVEAYTLKSEVFTEQLLTVTLYVIHVRFQGEKNYHTFREVNIFYGQEAL